MHLIEWMIWGVQNHNFSQNKMFRLSPDAFYSVLFKIIDDIRSDGHLQYRGINQKQSISPKTKLVIALRWFQEEVFMIFASLLFDICLLMILVRFTVKMEFCREH